MEKSISLGEIHDIVEECDEDLARLASDPFNSVKQANEGKGKVGEAKKAPELKTDNSFFPEPYAAYNRGNGQRRGSLTSERPAPEDHGAGNLKAYEAMQNLRRAGSIKDLAAAKDANLDNKFLLQKANSIMQSEAKPFTSGPPLVPVIVPTNGPSENGARKTNSFVSPGSLGRSEPPTTTASLEYAAVDMAKPERPKSASSPPRSPRKEASQPRTEHHLLESAIVYRDEDALSRTSYESERSLKSRDSGGRRSDRSSAIRSNAGSREGDRAERTTSASDSRSVLSSSNAYSQGFTRKETEKRRKGRRTRRKIPPVNLVEWTKHSDALTDSWARLMRKTNYTELGLAVYVKISENPILEPLFRFTDKQVQGTKFVDMLSAIVDNIGSPYEIDKKIASLAPMHQRRGVHMEQMPHMQQVTVGVMKSFLGSEFTEDDERAWDFIWDFMSKSMESALGEVGSTLGTVRMGWDSILDRWSAEQLGDKIYDYLFEVVPHVKTIFKKPRQVMAVKMGRALELLLSFVDDPKSMKQQMHWLGLRHVEYGVRPHHIPLMGPALVRTFSECAREEWTPEFEKGWNTVWEMVSTSMSEAIQEAEDHGFTAKKVTQEVSNRVSALDMGQLLQAELCISCPEALEVFLFDGSSVQGGHGGAGSSGPGGQGASRTKISMGASLEEESAHGDLDRIDSRDETAKQSDSGKFSFMLKSTPNDFGSSGRFRQFKKAKKSSHNPTFGDIGVSHKEDPNLSLYNQGTIGRAVSSALVKNSKSVLNSPFETTEHGAASRSDREVICLGLELWGLCQQFAEQLFHPEKQLEFLYLFCFKHSRRGLKTEHIQPIGEALRLAVEITEGEAAWTDEKTKHAWTWMWNDIAKMLQDEMEKLEKDYNGTVVYMWSRVKATVDVSELGDRFWNFVNEEAPEQVHLFRRPLKMWGHLLTHIMDMLVNSCTDPEFFFQEMSNLTIKHIQWGVKAESLFPFGNAIQYTLEEFMGKDWNEGYEEAWRAVWKRAALSMVRGLNLGDNLITRALVQGNVEGLEHAITIAPRCKRAEWLCKISINGQIINPLYWALRDGKFAVAEFILTDLLTIRADLTGYYYAVDVLFEEHKDLVGQLSKECPQLLSILLDGMLWHSREKLPGHLVRVNYYIKNLYGDPESHKDPWKSPLARLIQLGDNEIFKHPAVRKTLDLKWRSFGLLQFCIRQSWYLLFLFMYMVCIMGDPGGCDRSYDAARHILCFMAIVTLIFLLTLAIWEARKHKVAHIKIRALELKIAVPRTLANSWDLSRVIACFILIAVGYVNICGVGELVDGDNATDVNATDVRRWMLLAAKKPTSDSAVDGDVEYTVTQEHVRARIPWAISGALLWFQFFQCTILSTPMAAFIYTIGMMITDLSHSLFMIAVLLMTFGASLHVMEEEPFHEGFDNTVMILFQEVLGVTQSSYETITPFSRFLLLSFLTLVMVVMLNVLIAQLTITYDAVTKDKEGFALRYRASVCMDVESMMSIESRKKTYESLGFDMPLAFSASDEGPAGGKLTEP